MPKARILQVGYDASLLKVRAAMLEHAGYKIVSVLGNEAAMRVLEEESLYRLVVVGWSAPDAVRTEIVRWVKRRWPALRVMALYHAGGHPIAEADLNAPSESPAEWFGAVLRAAAS